MAVALAFIVGGVIGIVVVASAACRSEQRLRAELAETKKLMEKYKKAFEEQRDKNYNGAVAVRTLDELIPHIDTMGQLVSYYVSRQPDEEK